jgi:hypothetical protein
VKRPLDRIRQAISEGDYHITPHALEEMADDGLAVEDIEELLLTGDLIRRLTQDPRGERYELCGQALDGREVRVVCRFLPTGVLRVITAWALEEEEQ